MVLSRSSASSSSMVRSELRVTRKGLQLTTRKPGNRSPTWSVMRSSSSTKAALWGGSAGTSTSRGSTDGTWTTAMMEERRATRCRSLCSRIARFKLRLRRAGKGCPWSTARGVRTDQTSLLKWACTFARWVAVSCAGWRMAMPARSRSPGSMVSFQLR